MFNAVTSFLGDDVLMYASDYPHSECQFPHTVDNFLAWGSLKADTQQEADVGQRRAVFPAQLDAAKSRWLTMRP